MQIDSLESLTTDQLKLLAYCGHADAIDRVGEQSILHDDRLHVWLGGLKRWGTKAMVHAALAVVGEAFSHFDGTPWIRDCARPLLDAARSWTALSNQANAQRALAAAKQSSELAEKADELTTLVGDWWSCEAVEMCGLIPAAIAMEHGLLAPNRDIPGPPTEELVAVCRYFSIHPKHVERPEARIRQVVSEAIISWLLDRRMHRPRSGQGE